jgi:hypothetical protein
MNFDRLFHTRAFYSLKPSSSSQWRTRSFTNAADAKPNASGEPFISKRLEEILKVGVPFTAAIIAAVIYEGEKIERSNAQNKKELKVACMLNTHRFTGIYERSRD